MNVNGNGNGNIRLAESPSVRRARRKFFPDYTRLAKAVDLHRTQGRAVVATIGTWDGLHVGHVRYLNVAKDFGDLLIVGVDSDRATKLYKGPGRPINPAVERIELLTYQECVDFVAEVDDVEIIGSEDHKVSVWHFGLLQVVRPDVYVAVEDSYPQSQLDQIRQYCGELVVLPRQAETSTSEIIRRETIAAHAETEETIAA